MEINEIDPRARGREIRVSKRCDLEPEGNVAPSSIVFGFIFFFFFLRQNHFFHAERIAKVDLGDVMKIMMAGYIFSITDPWKILTRFFPSLEIHTHHF